MCTQKHIKAFLFRFIIIGILLLCSCSNKNNVNYTNASGYKEYVSDHKSGYSDLDFFNTDSSIENSHKAVEYYKNNSRVSGDFVVTDYMEGICINKYLGNSDSINIPDNIEGKNVIKIGSWLRNDNSFDYVCSPFAGIQDCVVNIPQSVKYIEHNALAKYIGHITDDEKKYIATIIRINVDPNNPFYSSKDGVLYNKNGDTLLYVDYYESYLKSGSTFEFEYYVPEQVKNFKPVDGVPCDMSRITFKKRIERIDAFVDYGEGGVEPIKDYEPNLVVEGYKNTVAEKWAKKWYLKFKALE